MRLYLHSAVHTKTTSRPIDQARLEAFLGQVVTDMGAGLPACSCSWITTSDCWKALEGDGPLTPAEIAAGSGIRER
jgi:hypothetical protein